MVEIADDLNALRIGSPNGKIDANVSVDVPQMGTKFFVDFPMLSGIE